MEEVCALLNKNNCGYTISQLKSIFAQKITNLEEVLNSLEIQGEIMMIADRYYKMTDDYVVGVLHSTKNGSKYIETSKGYRVYVKNDSLNGSLDFDLVLVKKKQMVDLNYLGEVTKVLKRKNPNIVCEVKTCNGIKNLVVFNGPWIQNLRIDKNNMDSLVDGDRILVSIPCCQDNNIFEATFMEHLGHKDDPDIDIKTIAISKDFTIDFSIPAKEEVKTLPTSVSKEDLNGRIDLRDKLIFTIDGENTKDVDDAISLDILPNGYYRLGVHIANVSHYIKQGMALFEEALNRGTSVYLLDYVIPMLPHLISNGICSLNPNTDRLTKSCIMDIDPQGHVVNYSICDTVINSKKKMTYGDVNEILENNNIPLGYEQYTDILNKMHRLSAIITNQRKNNGYLDFASNELNVSLDEEGNAIKFNQEQHLSAEKMIENFMILANVTVASSTYWQKLPFIYRVHECPSPEAIIRTVNFINVLGYDIKLKGDVDNPKIFQNILQQLSRNDDFPILSQFLLQGLKRAIYSPNNQGHFALATECYTHFTSPIRRFPDLMVHTLLDKYQELWNDKNYDNSALEKELTNLDNYLKEISEHASYKERQADAAEEEANKFKMLEYMVQYIGRQQEAVITMIDSKGLTIKTIDNIFGRVRIDDVNGDDFVYNFDKVRIVGKHSKTQYRIGNKVLVTTLEVSKPDHEIYFSIDSNISCKDNKNKVKQKTIF